MLLACNMPMVHCGGKIVRSQNPIDHGTGLITSAFALMFATAVYSADPPETIEQRKREAEEVIIVEVKSTRDSIIENGTFDEIVYTAKVIEVIRSKSGCKAGDEVIVEAVAPRPGTKVAGTWPPRLAKGWHGKMYLELDDSNGRYLPIANHASFEETKN
jgi:hypothetical protein